MNFFCALIKKAELPEAKIIAAHTKSMLNKQRKEIQVK